MTRFIVVTVLLASLYGVVHSELQTRVVGSSEADIRDAPWQVALLYGTNQTLRCGGSIIKESVILTSFDCAYETEPEGWIARAGSTLHDYRGQQRLISRIVLHEDALGTLYDYNLALFFTSSPFIQDELTVSTIRLPSQGQVVLDGSAAQFTGWGSVVEGGAFSRTLHKVLLPTVNQEVCARNYGSNITAGMLCAGFATGGYGICSGDFGGPLVINGTLAGVASWTWGCGQPGYPSVFVRVSAFRSWIDDHISIL